MRTRTTLAALAALLTAATLTACSSGTDSDPSPAPATVTATVSPSLNAEEAAQACANALYERAAAAQGEVPFEPTPAPCAPLGDSAYLDAYMASINQANREGLEEREQQREDAEQTARP